VLFNVDPDTKKVLNDVATLFGVKTDIVRDVWEYTVFSMVLNLLDSEHKTRHVTLPFIGRLALRYEGQEMKDGLLDDDVKGFVLLSQSFKELVSDVFTGDKTVLADYIKKKHLDRVIDDVENRELAARD
jgi:hypothetical protein